MDVTRACDAEVAAVASGRALLTVRVRVTDPDMRELTDMNNEQSFSVTLDCGPGTYREKVLC